MGIAKNGIRIVYDDKTGRPKIYDAETKKEIGGITSCTIEMQPDNNYIPVAYLTVIPERIDIKATEENIEVDEDRYAQQEEAEELRGSKSARFRISRPKRFVG